MSAHLTDAELRVLADRVLGGAEPSSLMVRAVESILAARLATAEAAEAALAGLVVAVEALADEWDVVDIGHPWLEGSFGDAADDLRARISADHAAALRAHEAKALRDAAEVLWDNSNHYGGIQWGRQDYVAWLRDRADSIEQARP